MDRSYWFEVDITPRLAQIFSFNLHKFRKLNSIEYWLSVLQIHHFSSNIKFDSLHLQASNRINNAIIGISRNSCARYISFYTWCLFNFGKMATIDYNNPILAWKRPDSVDFPKVWYTFKAREIDSESLIEYRIQDLPLHRVDDLYQHLFESFVPDEPIGQALGDKNDVFAFEDYRRLWAPIISQRTALVCFKGNSDDIVGANLVYISSKGDTYPRNMRYNASRFESTS